MHVLKVVGTQISENSFIYLFLDSFTKTCEHTYVLTKRRITERFRTLRVGVFFVSPAAEFQFPALKNDLERPIKGGPCQLGQKSVGGKEKKENSG